MNLKDLPPVSGVNFLQRVREMLQSLKAQVVTVEELKNAGVISVTGPPSAPVIEAGPVIVAEPEVDLTPPPTPTGLTVTAGLTRLIIEWNEATYTTGHGHDRTIIYGATYTSGPLPTFANAIELKQALGSVTDYTTNTGTQWHIWIKWRSKDGVLSSSPAGGTNGVQVTTGKVGTSDLNDLIITSQKLASGAVDALAKFGSGLEPVYNVAALPSPTGYTGPRTVFLSTDNKLYRYNGTAWTTAVPTTDLTGQVTSAQITDSAVTAAKIASGAINVFDKFAGGLEPVSAVGALPSPTGYTGPKTVLLTTDNKLYRYTGSAWTVAVPTTDLTGQVTTAQITDGAITQGKFSSGLEPVSVVAALPSPTGYTGPKSVFLTTDNKLYRYTGSAFSVAVPTADLTGQITTTQITDNAVTTAKVAANAITAGQIAANTITAGQIAANTITAGQIAAGTITATEIAASTITGAKIAAGTVTASNIAADTITANEIAANAITASEIATDAVTANKILAGSVTTAKIAAGAVTANEIAATTILAGNIAAGAVTTNKLFIPAIEGGALNVDPNFADSTAWSLLSGTAGSFTTITDGVVGNNVLRSASAAASVYGSVRRVPFDATKTYRVRARVRRDATANGTLTVAVALQDNAGANIVGDGTYWNHQAANAVTASTTWTTYSHTFGAGTAKTFAATGRTMTPVALLNTGGTAGFMEIQDFRIEEVVPGELIVDGSIVAAKIATDAVTANKIQAGAVVAGKIAANAIVAADGVIANGAITNALIGTAAVDTAKIADASIVTAKIADANVTTAKIADANITTAKIADANITTAKIADANITTAKIADANITTAKIASANITSALIANGSIQTAHITDANITTAKITDANITTLKIAGNAVTVPVFSAFAGFSVPTGGTVRAGATGNFTLTETLLVIVSFTGQFIDNAGTGNVGLRVVVKDPTTDLMVGTNSREFYSYYGHTSQYLTLSGTVAFSLASGTYKLDLWGDSFSGTVAPSVSNPTLTYIIGKR